MAGLSVLGAVATAIGLKHSEPSPPTPHPPNPEDDDKGITDPDPNDLNNIFTNDKRHLDWAPRPVDPNDTDTPLATYPLDIDGSQRAPGDVDFLPQVLPINQNQTAKLPLQEINGPHPTTETIEDNNLPLKKPNSEGPVNA